MSLLERLRPEYLKMIKAEEYMYPYSSKKIQIELAEINNWVDIKYSTVVYLVSILKINDYSPSAIDKLFTDENS
jgi:hypothetical protein